MKSIRQIFAVTVMNLSSIRQRLGTSLVIVIGIAGVVGVMVSVLSMAQGMTKTLETTGRSDRAIITRTGSSTEAASMLSRDAVRTIVDLPGIRHDSAGRPIASIELLRPVKVIKKGDGAEANATFRGVSAQAALLRPELRIVEGRMFGAALNEVIVGKNARAQFQGLEIGDEITATRSAKFTVVGIFATNGDAHESELLTDVETLRSAYQRNYYSSVTALLDSSESFPQFADAAAATPGLAADVNRESEYLARNAESISNLIAVIAYMVGGIMGVGAAFAALNTMYSAVSTRQREIATLRALGFGSAATAISVLTEALLLSMLGALAGAFGAWLFFSGQTVSSMAGGGLARQLVFELSVSPAVVATGIAWGTGIGFLGGLLPAMRAARLPIATALRST